MSNAEDRAEDQARAQVASIVEMVAALECDYDRLEELRDKAKAGAWVAGWNMPGYMPDSEPAAFEDCDEAREYIESVLRERAGETMLDGTRSNEETDAEEVALIEAADRMKKRVAENHEAEYGETIAGVHYWITHKPGELADRDEAKELAELEETAGECTSEDEARQRIHEDALSVEVRSDWRSPGEEMTAGEFRILLCTGGPHVELIGDLDQGEPSRVRVLYRDWGTSGEIFDFDHDAVLTYCKQHYFGE